VYYKAMVSQTDQKTLRHTPRPSSVEVMSSSSGDKRPLISSTVQRLSIWPVQSPDRTRFSPPPLMLKIIDAEVVIQGEGLTQRGGTTQAKTQRLYQAAKELAIDALEAQEIKMVCEENSEEARGEARKWPEGRKTNSEENFHSLRVSSLVHIDTAVESE